MKGVYMKHQMSCARDQLIDYRVDWENRTVECLMEVFDSQLFGHFVTFWLDRDEGVVAYFDDNSKKGFGWASVPADFKLYVTFAGTRFAATVVRLMKTQQQCDAHVAVILDSKGVQQRLF